MKSQTQGTNRKSFDSFATRFGFVRKKRGVSLGALAAGKPSTAKSWESGTMPRADLWERIAAQLNVSVSFLFLGHPKSPEDFDFLAKFANEIEGGEALRQRPVTDYDRRRDKSTRDDVLHEDGPPPMVASRITPAPGAPSSRADCEEYFAELLDAAERSGNPNAYPVIHDRLKKKFPQSEWEPNPEIKA